MYGPFFENRGENTLRCPYTDYNSLNSWQANRDLLSVIYFSVMTHRRKGKNVSILPLGDVNPRPIRSRRGLLEYSPYRAVGATCLSPRAWRLRDVLWSLPQDVNTFL
jgi:hypothetical protein